MRTHRPLILRSLALAALLLATGAARAEAALERFLGQSFAGATPAPAMLWLTPPVKARAAAILGHDFPGLRTRYWRQGERTAWVLDHVGKEQPITMGVVVEKGQILNIEVLAYRESRGGEIRHGFFRRQFERAALKPGDRLDRDIDGITGATLSVTAMTKVARLALAFHDEALRAR
ncbi:MAG TPA: FMN-binding protein [Moraxellaceae bacterium]|nr:FMN-binding protein [Moraxellaceae bacterium]